MVDVYVASAFSKNNKGGNKAGVVLDRPDLTPEQKMKIAKELGYSETAFVSASDVADFELQYFTPTEEVPLCGHATIATFSILNILNRLDKKDYTIETKAGVLKMQIKDDGMVLMEQNCPAYYEILTPDMFAGCLEPTYIDRKLPIQIISTGLKDIIVPIVSQADLEAIHPGFKNMKILSKETDAVGIHAFTLLKDNEVTAVCRDFAPLYGIDEESATGTASCALACYLFKYGEKKSQYIFEQGFNLGEPSRIAVNVVNYDDVIDSVYVGGYGYLVCEKAVSV